MKPPSRNRRCEGSSLRVGFLSAYRQRDQSPTANSQLGRALPSAKQPCEHGAALLEFTLVLPILVTLLFGAIDAGFALNDAGKLRQLVRQSTQLAASHSYGTKDSCNLSVTRPDSPSPALRESYRLFCRARFYGADAGMAVRTAVRVVQFDETGTPQSDAYSQGKAIMVCQQVLTSSRTGLLRPVFQGRLLRSSLTMRIHESDFAVGPTDAQEDPHSGDWSWCTPQARDV